MEKTDEKRMEGQVKQNMLKALLNDLKNGTSHSVGFLKEEGVRRTLSASGIIVRKVFTPLIRIAYQTQTEYKLIIDRKEKLKRSCIGKIFVINHRQADDIVIGAKVVNRSAYIVFGNPYLFLETRNGLGLWIYGVILLQRDLKSNRLAVYQKMKYVIEHGGNIIIYPEGYWNLDDNGEADEKHDADSHNSENWLIQDFNIGVFRLAQETGCEIVPTVLHYDEQGEKKCYASRGTPVRVLEDEDIFDKKDKLLEIMHTEYWRLMEKYSSYQRSELETQESLSQQWQKLKSELRTAGDIERIGYRLDLDDEKKIGKAKVLHGVVTHQEAFAWLNNKIETR